MNWADYTILAVLALSVVMGLWRGFVGEVMALVCWALAFWVAWTFGPPLAERFSASISTPSVRVLLAYVLAFVAVLIAGAIVTWFVRKLVESSGLSGSDRMLGMVFGLVRGLALVTLVVLLMEFTPFRRDPWWGESRLLPNFEIGARWLGDRLPAEVAKYLDMAGTAARPILPTVPTAPAAQNPSST